MFSSIGGVIDAFLSHKTFNAPTYMVVITAALSLLYIGLCVRFFLHMRGLGVTWGGKKKKMALLLGPRNAGKTQFFHAIRDGQLVDTVSSMKEATFQFQVHPKYNPSKFDAELTVVDYPGSQRLRAYVGCCVASFSMCCNVGTDNMTCCSAVAWRTFTRSRAASFSSWTLRTRHRSAVPPSTLAVL